jgi:hypothetical protein
MVVVISGLEAGHPASASITWVDQNLVAVFGDIDGYERRLRQRRLSSDHRRTSKVAVGTLTPLSAAGTGEHRAGTGRSGLRCCGFMARSALPSAPAATEITSGTNFGGATILASSFYGSRGALRPAGLENGGLPPWHQALAEAQLATPHKLVAQVLPASASWTMFCDDREARYSTRIEARNSTRIMTVNTISGWVRFIHTSNVGTRYNAPKASGTATTKASIPN